MIRSSVVLPPPDGPSSATSSPGATVKLTSSSATKLPKPLLTLRTSMAIVMVSTKPDLTVRCGYVVVHVVSDLQPDRLLDRRSTIVLRTSVTSASNASSDATANAAWKLYSL